MDCSAPGFHILHHLLELAQTYVHWVGDAIQPSSVVPFSSRLQPFPAIGSFQMSQFSPSGGQSIGVAASASVLPMNIQDWFTLGWTGWISLQSKGLSRVFSKTTVQKHQFFGAQLSSQSNSHFRTWPLAFAGKVISLLFNMLSRLVLVRYIKMGNQESCVGLAKFEMLWNNQIQVI